MTHHAYIYEGALAQVDALVADARKRFGFSDHHSPDVHVSTVEVFGIAEARALRESALLRHTAGKSLFIIAASSITTEAQQALLKLFEEPQQGAVFILLVPHGMVLSTLRSRCVPYPTSLAQTSEEKEAISFLRMAYKERSASIAALLKDDTGVRDRVRQLVNALEAVLARDIDKPEIRSGLAEIGFVRGYLADRAPSYKMLLEHLAAVLPVRR